MCFENNFLNFFHLLWWGTYLWNVVSQMLSFGNNMNAINIDSIFYQILFGSLHMANVKHDLAVRNFSPG